MKCEESKCAFFWQIIDVEYESHPTIGKWSLIDWCFIVIVSVMHMALVACTSGKAQLMLNDICKSYCTYYITISGLCKWGLGSTLACSPHIYSDTPVTLKFAAA